MKRRYFKSNDSTWHVAKNEWLEIRKKVMAAAKELSAELSADETLIMTRADVVFYRPGFAVQPDGWKTEVEWLGHRKMFTIKPDRRTKKGKEYLLKVRGLNHAAFHIYAMKKMELPRYMASSVEAGRPALLVATCGYVGDTFLYQFPVGDESSEFEKPDWLTEIKKSEFIAINEEGA